MSKYYCKCCKYDAKVKGNYIKHLKTFKHKKIEQIQLTQSHKKIDCSKKNDKMEKQDVVQTNKQK